MNIKIKIPVGEKIIWFFTLFLLISLSFTPKEKEKQETDPFLLHSKYQDLVKYPSFEFNRNGNDSKK